MDFHNLYDNIPSQLPEELFTDILKTQTFRMERIVSQGHASPEGFWYDQDQNEWVMVLEGAARIRIEDRTDAVELRPGDYLTIPAYKRHRVEWTAPDQRTVWLAVHFQG
ncbi:MAG: cupin domain-containing protein [Pirellulaceae bacterium]